MRNDGPEEIAVAMTTLPRDTIASFDPQIITQRLRRLTDIDRLCCL
jgi:hypothetical protein